MPFKDLKRDHIDDYMDDNDHQQKPINAETFATIQERTCYDHFEQHDLQFHVKLKAAKEHFKGHGGWKMCTIIDPSLRFWVASQRQLRNKGKLCRCRVQQLNAIGFEWSEDQWNASYERLVAYHEKHGNCQVDKRQQILFMDM
jgi:Helicase associated domain